jgi:ribonuclease D
MARKTPKPQFVDSPQGLSDFLGHIDGEPDLAVDTEANPMFAYRERLCLIQVAAGRRIWLIDPLAELDLTPFLDVLADPDVTKVFHDAEFDIVQVGRCFGTRVLGLFDTKVAAVACGEKSVGLAGLCERHFGIELDKSQQRSDWGRRPLDARQLEYAGLDVHYLLPLAEVCKKNLARLDPIVSLEVGAELQRLEKLDTAEPERDPFPWRRIKGSSRLDPKGMRVISKLWSWREGEAERRDLPPFKVLASPVILTLAQRRPKSMSAIAELVPRAIANRHAKALLGVLQEAAEMSGLTLPRGTTLPREERKRAEEDHRLLDRLKRWRKRVAESRPTDPSLILNRDIMEELSQVCPRPTNRAELAATGLLESWRLDAHCEELLSAMRKR